MSGAGDVLRELGRRRVVAVVRAGDPAAAVDAARALAAGGVTAIEITFTTPGAAEAIADVALLDGVLVGAGTVTTRAEAEAAVAAGARFLASPHLSTEALDAGEESDVLAIPGVFTPTEVAAASKRAPLLKLFPASVGGPGLLAALRGPFPSLRFMPTGGVTADNARAWLGSGAYVLGAGGDLCSAARIAAGDFAAIERRAADYRAAVDGL